MNKRQGKRTKRPPKPLARCGQIHCPCRDLCLRAGPDARLDHGGVRIYTPELITTQLMDGEGNIAGGMAYFLRCGGMKRNNRRPEPTLEGILITPLVDLLAKQRCSEAKFFEAMDSLQKGGFMDIGYYDPPEMIEPGQAGEPEE